MTQTTSKHRATPATDMPYVMRLPDGRAVFLSVPRRYVVPDGDDWAFTPDGVRWLDHVRILAMKTPPKPTPGYLRTLREALGMTQGQFGQRLGVDKMTVWRWEHGQLKPGPASLRALEALRREATRKGVMLAG